MLCLDFVKLNGFGVLGLVRVLGTCVNVQVVDELVTKTGLGQHALHRPTDEFGGSFCKDLAGRGEALATRITGVANVNAVGHLFAGKTNLICIDDDDVVTTVHMRGVTGLVLATQHQGDAGSQATEHEVGCINDEPLLVHSCLVQGNCFVAKHYLGQNQILYAVHPFCLRGFGAPALGHVVQGGHDFCGVLGGDQFDAGVFEVPKALEVAGKVAAHFVHARDGAFEVQGQLEMAFREGHAVPHAHGRELLPGIQQVPDFRENPRVAKAGASHHDAIDPVLGQKPRGPWRQN